MPESGTYTILEDYQEGDGNLRYILVQCNCPAGAATFEKAIRPVRSPVIGELLVLSTKAGPTPAPTNLSDLAIYDIWDTTLTLKVISDVVAAEGQDVLSGTLNTVISRGVFADKPFTGGVYVVLSNNAVNGARFQLRLVFRVR